VPWLFSVHKINTDLIQTTLSLTSRSPDGRLIMPLSWKAELAPFLSSNRDLALAILKSNERKLRKDHAKLTMIDEVFKEQEAQGVIERVEEDYLALNPCHSYIPRIKQNFTQYIA